MNSLFEVGTNVIPNENPVVIKSLQGVNSSKPAEINIQGVYKSSNGSNYFARFPVMESRLKDIERNSVAIPINTFAKSVKESTESIKEDDSIFSGLLIFLAIIVMIYEWYLFSRRA